MKNLLSALLPHRRKGSSPPPDGSTPQTTEIDDEKSAVKRIFESRKNTPFLEALAEAVGANALFDDAQQEAALGKIFQCTPDDFMVSKGDGKETRAAKRRAFVGDSASSTVMGKLQASAGKAAKAYQPIAMYGIHPQILQWYQSYSFIGWPACAAIAQHPLVNRACSIPAEDSIAHGYKLICASHSHAPTATHDADEARWLMEIKRYSDRMGMNDTCIQLNYKKSVFGVGLAVPRVDGADYEKPFNIDGIKKGSYHGFAVIDPYWLTPELDEDGQTNPTSPSFYDPAYFRAPNGKRIHKSWIVRVVNTHVPDCLKPTYYYGSVPLPQMIYERMYCADKIANEAPQIARTKRLLIVDANVEELTKDNKHASRIMQMINHFRDNFSVFFKKPGMEVKQIDTSLGEFDQLIMTQYQLVASIAQMPATKLLMVTPTGFQSTGEHEWKNYAQKLLDIQNNEYTPLLDMHYELLLKSLYPDRDDLSVRVVFNPIDIPTKDQNATIEAREAQTASTLINAGVITPDEARTRMRTDEQGMYGFLDPELPESLRKQQEAKLAQATGAGAPGMPGMPPGGGGEGDEAAPGEDGGEGEPEPADPTEEYSQEFTEAVDAIRAMASPDNPAFAGEGEDGGDSEGEPESAGAEEGAGDEEETED